MAQRFNPTADKASDLRAALAAAGCIARVARLRLSFRIVPADAAEICLAASVARSAGFSGPLGGDIVRSGNCLFAYDVRA